MVLYCHGLYRYGQGLLPTRHAAHARAMQRILRHRRHRRHPLRLHQRPRSSRHYLEKTATAVLARRGLARPAVTAAVQSHPTVQQAVMADIVMASIVGLYGYGLCGYGLCAYGLYKYGFDTHSRRSRGLFSSKLSVMQDIVVMVYIVMAHRNCPPCRI